MNCLSFMTTFFVGYNNYCAYFYYVYNLLFIIFDSKNTLNSFNIQGVLLLIQQDLLFRTLK